MCVFLICVSVRCSEHVFVFAGSPHLDAEADLLWGGECLLLYYWGFSVSLKDWRRCLCVRSAARMFPDQSVTGKRFRSIEWLLTSSETWWHWDPSSPFVFINTQGVDLVLMDQNEPWCFKCVSLLCWIMGNVVLSSHKWLNLSKIYQCSSSTHNN